ncbi:hypothetical protein L0152_25980 [bacterium]|nr:hypothetical protein [bacterium]
MKTLTITAARKNLGRLLSEAAQGEDIGIICGADIIALRKVNVESTDYAHSEYGASPDDVIALEKNVDSRYKTLKKSGRLVTVTDGQLRKALA